MDNEELLPKGTTEEQITQWKKQHQGRIFVIDVEDDFDGNHYVGIFKEPSMKTISAVAHMAKTDEVKSMQIMYEDCKVHTDPELDTVTSLRMSAMKEMQKIVAVKKTKFRRL